MKHFRFFVVAGLFLLAGSLLPSTNAFAALGASVTLYPGDPGTIVPGQTTRLEIARFDVVRAWLRLWLAAGGEELAEVEPGA